MFIDYIYNSNYYILEMLFLNHSVRVTVRFTSDPNFNKIVRDFFIIK